MFTYRLSQEEYRSIHKTIQEGKSLLNSTGCEWFLSHGTLLGSWRHKNIIPWDDDLDIAFPMDKIDVLLSKCTELGWKFCRLDTFLGKIWKPESAMYKHSYQWTWPFIEISFYNVTRDYIVIEHDYHASYKSFKKTDLLPISMHEFGDDLFPIPKNTNDVLYKIYPLWSIMPKSSSYNHRLETKYSEPSEQLNVSKLCKKFNMFNINIPECKPKYFIGNHSTWKGTIKLNENGTFQVRGYKLSGFMKHESKKYIAVYWDNGSSNFLYWDETINKFKDVIVNFTIENV